MGGTKLFNLLDEPWLSVRRGDDSMRAGSGLVEDIGLRQLLLEADRFQDLIVDLPTQKPALYRQLLLPIVLDALSRPGKPGDWAVMFERGAFTSEQRSKLTDYFSEHHDLFDLFDPQNPFGQVADLRTAKDETKGSALLVATAATGNNVPLFSSRTEGDPLELSPAQAARWLLHTHCWDTAAIKTGAVGDAQMKAGKTTGNPTGPLGQLGVVLPRGRTVYETLLLNIPSGQPIVSDDRPQWRRRARDGKIEETLSCATPEWRIRPARGLLDLWTWQSRRIRLIPEETPLGITVTRVIVAAGDRLTATPPEEPHTTWSKPRISTRPRKATSTKKTTASTRPAKAPAAERPRQHRPGQAAWRGLGALLALGSATDDRDATTKSAGFRSSVLLGHLAEVADRMSKTYPLQVELTGIVYGNQSAVIEDVFFDELPLPLAALDPDGEVCEVLLDVVGKAEELATAVNDLSADLRRAAGSDPIPWDKGQRPGDTLLHALDPLVRRLLVGLRKADEASGDMDQANGDLGQTNGDIDQAGTDGHGSPECNAVVDGIDGGAVGDEVDRFESGRLAWEQKAGRLTWIVAEQVLATASPGLFSGRKVTKDGREIVHRLSTAERAFRCRVNKILSRRAAHLRGE
ncbi:type I-E CRISPR-associated protein Cse1/CasA [Streptomyces albipurpureus]|uniref:Type I-E CRISPR-associated protein Cse1/CasA n=1 Tax=Streptomyces albipurpureus TaxID=2897419 RepID=A0ABT0UWR9_9ACTN|nr:type I-E CRISPR-associated protein Cse1/CasA [Streptomyces sp. CWNU-1]MCM2393033.1 type I-E CRISPR-associated protein Cse1/CasA [Streptomyces sp. CWNU-1]